MSQSFRTRQKSIRNEKRRLGIKQGQRIPPAAFEALRETWRAALRGPFIGTLADVMAERDKRRAEAKD